MIMQLAELASHPGRGGPILTSGPGPRPRTVPLAGHASGEVCSGTRDDSSGHRRHSDRGPTLNALDRARSGQQPRTWRTPGHARSGTTCRLARVMAAQHAPDDPGTRPPGRAGSVSRNNPRVAALAALQVPTGLRPQHDRPLNFRRHDTLPI